DAAAVFRLCAIPGREQTARWPVPAEGPGEWGRGRVGGRRGGGRERDGQGGQGGERTEAGGRAGGGGWVRHGEHSWETTRAGRVGCRGGTTPARPGGTSARPGRP